MATKAKHYAPIKDGGGHPFPVADDLFAIKDCYLGNPLVKRAHVKQDLKPEQLIELVKCRNDPIYFAENYCRIISIDEGIVPFKLYKFQKRMIKQYYENRFALTVTARQMGKTTSVGTFILWFALFHTDKECAILANKGAQAQEVVSRIRMMYEYLPFFLQVGAVTYNKGSIEFDNRSKIISAATSASSIRGHSVALLYIDEAAFIENDLEFYTSTYPVVTSGKESRVIMTSTPKGKRGMFYKLYSDGKEGNNEYQVLTVKWDHHPNRDEAWKVSTVRNTSAQQFSQEFECSFLGSSGTLIDSDTLQTMIFLNPINEDEHMFIYEEYNKDRRYVLVADPGEGVGQDFSVATVFDVTAIPYKVVAKYRNNYISPMMFPHTIMSIAMNYGACPVLVEANNACGGQVAYGLYYDLEYENVVLTTQDVKGQGATASPAKRSIPGVKTTTKVKSIGCSNLKAILENGTLEVPDFHAIEELGTFIQKGKSFEADDDCHDDVVMTLVLFSWFVKQDFFRDYADSDIGAFLYEKQKLEIESEILPFGFIVNGQEEETNIYTEVRGGMIITNGTPSGFDAWMNA